VLAVALFSSGLLLSIISPSDANRKQDALRNENQAAGSKHI